MDSQNQALKDAILKIICSNYPFECWMVIPSGVEGIPSRGQLFHLVQLYRLIAFMVSCHLVLLQLLAIAHSATYLWEPDISLIPLLSGPNKHWWESAIFWENKETMMQPLSSQSLESCEWKFIWRHISPVLEIGTQCRKQRRSSWPFWVETSLCSSKLGNQSMPSLPLIPKSFFL